MRVIVYKPIDPMEAVPRSMWFVAIIVERGERMPIQFHGADADALRAKAEKWWADALKKERNKKPRGGQRAVPDPDLNAALQEDAEKLEALGHDPGPTLDDIEEAI
jgi:hypothetical protein